MESSTAAFGRRTFLKVGAVVTLSAAGLPFRVLSATDDYVLLTSADSRYPALTQSYNRRSRGAPRYIGRCLTGEGVRQVLERGLAADWSPITVRGGGHCFENFVTGNRGGLLIDVSPLAALQRVSSSLYRIGAGCTLGRVHATLDANWGVAIPGGSCPSVGIAGHTLGGGYGFLSKRHGLVADFLRGVELVSVTAAGRVIRAYYDATSATGRDVLWASRGAGGGQFGIATRFDFRALPARPARVYLGYLQWRWSDLTLDRFTRLLRAFSNHCEASAAVTAPGGRMFASVRATHVTRGNIRLLVVSSEAGAADLRPFMDRMLNAAGVRAITGARLSPISLVRYTAGGVPYEEVSWRECVRVFGGANSTLRSKQKSAFVRRALTDAHIAVVYRFLRQDQAVTGSASFDLASFGGAINTPAVTSSAFRTRAAAMRILTQNYWANAADDALNISWCRRFHAALFADQGGEPMPSTYWLGSYINYPDRDLTRFRTLYYGANLPRLVQIKNRVDPLTVFRHPQGVV